MDAQNALLARVGGREAALQSVSKGTISARGS